MFREMLRRRQALSQSECEAILRRAASGVLAVQGDDGYPYAVPLSFVYWNGRLYFHGGSRGHRKDAIRRCDKASFCVVDQDQIVPEEYTSYFRSVIAFGRVRELTDQGEALAALRALGEKYNPGDETGLGQMLERSLAATRMQEMVIEHLSGKQASELLAPPPAGADAR